jgi:adhesin transport system outer membrane protein
MYPQLDLQLNGRTGHDLGGVEGRDTSASALVVMNWNLYRGGADVARAREFIHRHQQSKESRAKAARGVENDVRQTWASMTSAGERAKEFAAQADANTEVVKAYRDQFNLDRRTLLDVLDAQNELFVSRSNAINAEFLEVFAVYRLLALKGSLLPTLEVAYPRESVTAAKDSWSTDEQMQAR